MYKNTNFDSFTRSAPLKSVLMLNEFFVIYINPHELNKQRICHYNATVNWFRHQGYKTTEYHALDAVQTFGTPSGVAKKFFWGGARSA